MPVVVRVAPYPKIQLVSRGGARKPLDGPKGFADCNLVAVTTNRGASCKHLLEEDASNIGLRAFCVTYDYRGCLDRSRVVGTP